MYRKEYRNANAPTDMAQYRGVTLTPATGTVAYTVAGAKPDAITMAPERGGIIPILPIRLVLEENIELGGVVAMGDELEIGVDGKFIKLAAGTTSGLRANEAGKATQYVGGYNAN